MNRVLVVDDEAGIAELLVTVLEDDGLHAVAAGDGRDALARLADERFDLVLTDTTMPVMDGPSLARAMRDDGHLRDVPVVAFSAMPEATVGPCYPGYAAFVAKPFRVLEVLDLVNRLLGRS